MAVHRYKANESGGSEKVTKETKKVVAKTKVASKKQTEVKAKTRKQFKIFTPFTGSKNYVVNSWHELKQVHWPDRKKTWVLTVAVIVFSVLLGLLIFLLDAGFTYLFKTVIF